MKRFKCLLSAPVRRSVAMPLIFGWAMLGEAPTVEAGTDEVNLIDGFVDVDQNGIVDGADDLVDVILLCNVAAPIQVDIINGRVDVTENRNITNSDDLFNCSLTDENPNRTGALVPTTNLVDIINGRIDVNEDGVLSTLDAASNIKLFVP